MCLQKPQAHTFCCLVQWHNPTDIKIIIKREYKLWKLKNHSKSPYINIYIGRKRMIFENRIVLYTKMKEK